SSTVQLVPGAVHPWQGGEPLPMQPPAWFSRQQFAPRPPQVAQALLEQVPSGWPLPSMHGCPAATHLVSTQHPPPSHPKAGQQGWPGPPQPGPKRDPPPPVLPAPAPVLPAPAPVLPAPAPVEAVVAERSDVADILPPAPVEVVVAEPDMALLHAA